jgi:hypothetical protein
MAESYGPLGGPEMPTPRRESTITSYFPLLREVTILPPLFLYSSYFFLQSSLAGSATGKHST